MNEVATSDPRRDVVAWLSSDRIVEQVRRALPDHVPLDWFMRAAQTAILMKPELAAADKASLLRELVAVAQLGLVMDPQLGEAWLIIDRHRKVQRRVGYQGLRKLALQSGQVTALNAQAVYQNDKTDIDLGDTPHVHHKIDVTLPDRGKLLGCYAVGRVAGSELPVVEWMSWKQIEDHRNRYSDAYKGKSGPWADPIGEVEMGRKTVFRRLCKWLPKSPLLAEALAHEDRLDMRDVTPGLTELPAPDEPEPASPLAPQVRAAAQTSADAEDGQRDSLTHALEDPERLQRIREASKTSGSYEYAPEQTTDAQPKKRGRRSNREIDEDDAEVLIGSARSATRLEDLDEIYAMAEFERLHTRASDLHDEVVAAVEQRRSELEVDPELPKEVATESKREPESQQQQAAMIAAELKSSPLGQRPQIWLKHWPVIEGLRPRLRERLEEIRDEGTPTTEAQQAEPQGSTFDDDIKDLEPEEWRQRQGRDEDDRQSELLT